MGALRKPLTIDQFVEWEQKQEGRYEYDGIQTYAMTGGTSAHAAIQIALTSALHRRLKGKPCRPFGSELQLRLENSIRYPDAFVICLPVAPSATYVTEPVVIFEVLSKNTAWQDLGPKTAEYQATPSVQRYIVLQQTTQAAEVFFRLPDGEWTHEFVAGDKLLDMPEIGISIPLAEIYDDITLPL